MPSRKNTTISQTTKIENHQKSDRAGQLRRQRIVGSMYRPLCKILILIGIATILLAIVVVWQYRASVKRTSTTIGQVTEVDKVNGVGNDEHGDNAQKCRIGYRVSIDGVDYTDVLGHRGDPTVDKCNLSVGETIQIKYDPQHPANNAYLVDDETSDHQTVGETIGSAVTIAIVGLVPLIIGMLGLFVANRRNSDLDDDTSRLTDNDQSPNHTDTKHDKPVNRRKGKK